MKSDTAQRQVARKFVEYWTFRRGSEKGEDQQFWNSLLRDVLGVADVIYDRAKPLAPPLTLKLGNLPKEAYRLAFLVNPNEKAIDRELEISVQAATPTADCSDLGEATVSLPRRGTHFSYAFEGMQVSDRLQKTARGA